MKPLNELFPIRAEIASSVLNDGRGECQFLIGQTLVCLHLLLPADLREVREKTNSQEVRYQLSLISFHHVLTMFLSPPQCPDF